MVDVYVLRPVAGGWEALCLRRAPADRSPGTWETVHGHILEGETPVAAAVRELAEETGLAGTLGLLALIGIFAARGMVTAMRAPDQFRRILAAGLPPYLAERLALGA